MFIVPCALIASALLTAQLAPTDREADTAVAAASIQDMSKWIMNYYRQPDPAAVPARIRRMSELKMLQSGRPESSQMFLGQIMRANPKKIAEWLEQLKDLPEKDRGTLYNAAWISQTEQAKKWLADNGHQELAEKAGHPLVTGAAMVLEPYHVDLLWEWFFATGEKAPIQQIVGKFNLLSADPGDDELPKKPAQGLDRPTFLRETIGGVAVWSASSLAMQHDKLLTHLQEIQTDPKLPARGGAWLKRVVEIAERERNKPK